MNQLERLVVQRHRHRDERPYQRFGVCSSCGRYRDGDGRALWVTGRRQRSLICLGCFDLAPATRRQARAA